MTMGAGTMTIEVSPNSRAASMPAPFVRDQPVCAYRISLPKWSFHPSSNVMLSMIPRSKILAGRVTQALLLTTFLLEVESTAFAQQAVDAGALATFQGGVPSGQVSAEEMLLTLTDTISRGLRSNLGAILSGSAVELAQGVHREARSELLPQVRLSSSESRQKINLAAYGFSTPGTSDLVGPFNVFDARAHVVQSVLDLRAVHRSRAAADGLEAARQDELGARDIVVLACGQFYLQALAGEARIEAVRAQLATAEALLVTARDKRSSGLGAGIDVLRADVQAQSLQQRLIAAEQDAAKQKLVLARAIGLPLGQRFRLADPMPSASGVPMSVDEAVSQAWAARPDLKAAQARLEAATEGEKAARGERLPSLVVAGDYGAIGNTVSGALGTFSVGAALRVPVFEGGRVEARVSEAAVRVRQERARLDDLKARVYYEVQAVFLDLKATEESVRVGESVLALARQQLEQSRDRFAAGVADNLEVVQAQEAVASAEERRIAALYANNVARFSLARALGGAEASYLALVKGS
jgi:outer membrane protein TolC